MGELPEMDLGAKRLRAWNAVHAAIARGELKRGPCEICGEERTDAHHDDYDKPLDVRWLCARHHRRAHRESKSHLAAGSRLAPDAMSLRQFRERIRGLDRSVEVYVTEEKGGRRKLGVWFPVNEELAS